MKCKKCGKTISKKKENIYCSRSCSASQNNIGVSRNFIHGNNKKKPCVRCCKETTNLKFCSRACFNEEKREQTEKIILSGKYSKNITSQRTLRRALARTRGAACETCKLSEWQGRPIPLNVHHVDGNAHNNSVNNLKLLCLNCHGLTGNYGRKNKRSSRTQRYAK